MRHQVLGSKRKEIQSSDAVSVDPCHGPSVPPPLCPFLITGNPRRPILMFSLDDLSLSPVISHPDAYSSLSWAPTGLNT